MKKLQILMIILIVLISLRFFDAVFLNKRLVNYVVFLSLAGIAAISFPYFASFKKGFVLPVQLIVVSVFISIFAAVIFWEQELRETLIVTSSYFIWLFFFYLLHARISINKLERIIIGYGIIYCLLYFFQLYRSPEIFFGKSLWGDEFTVDRGITRIIFPGGGLFILAIFIAINKLTTLKNHRLFWLIIAALGLLIPVLQVTRQFIAGILFIYVIHFTAGTKPYVKALAITMASAFLIFFYYSDIELIRGIREAMEKNLTEGSDYIRVKAGAYFLTDFSPNNIARVIGNGVPDYGITRYGKFQENLTFSHNYFLSDVGIIAVYAMFGILSIIGYVLIWIKSFTIQIPREFYYVKYYLWFLLFTSLTWYSVYHYHYLTSTVFVLYIYQTLYQNQTSPKIIEKKKANRRFNVLKDDL